ncbi:MAG: SGNH/GDSL hydrolase family protein [Pseudobacter sp.]|uniref:SGNH/GDSL hydrolase family protein n=1 Tax=Pseudobacter sp. TaxID=2045420 RepID=UPI003F80CB27
MLRNLLLVVLCLACLPGALKAQPPLIFPKNSKVCFVGNSITMAGEYVHYIRSYYATKYPDRQVNFINCGISGDITGGILARMQPDIMVHKPEYAVIMIGMNDVNRPLYAAKFKGVDSIEKKKKEALETYKKNLLEIVQYFVQNKIVVILQKPSIYDQTAKIPQENLFGVNDALKACADYMQTLANKYQLRTVDYWTLMTEINKKMQVKDSSFTIVGKDRVHPASPGHFTMAYQFLRSTTGKSINAPVALDFKTRKGILKSVVSERDVEFTKNGLKIWVKPVSLPYVVATAAAPALDLVPFTNDFNMEILLVRSLPKGTYRIFINDSTAGEFSSDQLAKGINLATLNTAGTRQAQQVIDHCLKMKAVESDLRQLRHMEYRTLYKLPNGNITDSGIAILQRKLADSSTKKNERPPAERYLKNKPREAELYKQWDVMQAKLYEINKPQPYNIVIEKI